MPSYKTMGGATVKVKDNGDDFWSWRCQCGAGDWAWDEDAKPDMKRAANEHAKDCHFAEDDEPVKVCVSCGDAGEDVKMRRDPFRAIRFQEDKAPKAMLCKSCQEEREAVGSW